MLEDVTVRLQAAHGGRGFTVALWSDQEKEWILMGADKSLEHILDITRVALLGAEYKPVSKVPAE